MTIAQNNLLFNAADMAADKTSPTLDLSGCRGAAILVKSPATGTRVGEIHFEMSVTEETDDWVTVYTIPVSTLTAIRHLQEIPNTMNAQFLRVRWARTSGDGALTAIARLNRTL